MPIPLATLYRSQARQHETYELIHSDDTRNQRVRDHLLLYTARQQSVCASDPTHRHAQIGTASSRILPAARSYAPTPGVFAVPHIAASTPRLPTQWTQPDIPLVR